MHFNILCISYYIWSQKTKSLKCLSRIAQNFPPSHSSYRRVPQERRRNIPVSWTRRQNKSIQQRDDRKVGRPDGGNDQTTVLVFRSREFLRAKQRVERSRGMMFLVGTAVGAGRRNAEVGRELAKERGPSQDFREFNIVLGASADSPGV